jgi:pyruvate dehydrogenase E1 component beta subunit
MLTAIRRTLEHELATNPRIVVFGEDVETIRRTLALRFGPARVRNTPISEAAFLGAGVGAAMAGLRPVVEITMSDFLPVAMDMLVNHAAKLRAFSDGRWRAPLVVRCGAGGGYGDGGQHEQALWGMIAGVPGLAVVVPSTPADAAGLMLAALDYGDPVVLFEHKLLTGDVLDSLAGTGRPGLDLDVPAAGARGEVPEPVTAVPIGSAVLRREGTDLLIVGVGVGIHRGRAAAERLAADGVQAAVLDLRSVAPLDERLLLDLAAATRHVLVVDEDYTRGGLSGEIAAVVAERGVPARFARVTCEDTIPYARRLEERTLPGVARIVAAAQRLVAPGPRTASPVPASPVPASPVPASPVPTRPVTAG